MDGSSAAAPASKPIHPRHLGLPRRQSFDPLSSTKGSLTLGSLPAPSFGAIPNGLRSVPAIESTRHLGSAAFRNISAPLGDGQRTPGGSLVIGAEVFGFGKYAPKDPKERRINGSVDAEDGGAASRILTGWPSEYGSRATVSTDDLRLPEDSRFKADRLSGDFSSATLPRPQHNPAGTSVDLRPSSPASAMTDSLRAPSQSSLLPSSTLASQSSGGDSHEASPLGSSGTLSDPATNHTAATSAAGASAYGLNPDSTPSPNSAPYVYPFQPPDPSPPPLGNPYFNHGFAIPMSPPHHPRNGGRPGEVGGYGGYQQQQGELTSPDDLAFGMRGMNLGGAGANGSAAGGGAGANGGAGGGRGGGRNAVYSPDPYGNSNGGAPSRDQPSRQNSTGFQPYFMAAPTSPFLAQQDLYSPMGFASPPPPFYSPDGPGGRRDSVCVSVSLATCIVGLRKLTSYSSVPTLPSIDSPITSPVPGWGLAMPPFALAPEYQPAGAPPSTVPSRQGSFSYTPSGLPANGASPYAPAGPGYPPPSSGYEHAGPPPPGMGYGGPGPQLGQQHQIILGRGVRGVEYIAPGPVQPHGYGAGYGPDMRSLRSPLLEEFRSNRNRSWELADLAGHIVEFSGDQLGSRHIQTKLDMATTDEKSMVFQEILPNMLQLSTDVFANYVIQKFFEQGSQVQKTAMAKVLEGHVLQLSLQMYGCRVVQKALEYVLVDQQVRLVKELDGHVLKCARDAQSNHVVQRALERVPPEHLHFITDACVGQVHGLATHPYGCRVLQRIFENCPPPQTRTLLDELHRFTQNLIQDQYGNYVVQWVIEKGEQPDRSLVIAKVYGQLLPLAQQKFASNVVEKCIVHGTPEERARLVDELLTPAPDGTSQIKAALVHPYANYVVQKCLHCTVGKQREALFTEVTSQLINLRRYSSTYSKHLVAIQKTLITERERAGLPPIDFGGGPAYPILDVNGQVAY
ncbi:hypothetical protein JCM8097_008284 [Rhodosporidiobolus ruineniae]